VRDTLPQLRDVPLPGAGTHRRWRVLIGIAKQDLARARLAEGHLDALAILDELGASPPRAGALGGVWAAEPAALRAQPVGSGWELVGEKRWCSASTALDFALVTATAPDGPRLFLVEPEMLEPVTGSWPAIGMEATASMTMRFDATFVPNDCALGGPDAYVDRPGFWHGGAGVAACWFGGALGVAERLRIATEDGDGVQHRPAWGRVSARLSGASALLARTAAEIDAAPLAVTPARLRALRLRLAVEDAARATIADTLATLGAGPLAHEREFARHVVDLELYLAQLRPQAAAAELGAMQREPVEW
jgi:alkylation response protein AidB-like acyl-CoA dehydrogenase